MQNWVRVWEILLLYWILNCKFIVLVDPGEYGMNGKGLEYQELDKCNGIASNPMSPSNNRMSSEFMWSVFIVMCIPWPFIPGCGLLGQGVGDTRGEISPI